MEVAKIMENLSSVFVPDEETFKNNLKDALDLFQRSMEMADRENTVIYLEDKVKQKEANEQACGKKEGDGDKGKVKIVVGRKELKAGTGDMIIDIDINGKFFLQESGKKQEDVLNKVRESLVGHYSRSSEEWKILIDFLQGLENLENMKKTAKFLHQRFYDAKNLK